MDNFQDRYIRVNPRRNAKMNPILWDDNTSRYLKYHGNDNKVECFKNMDNSKTHTQIKCNKGIAQLLINKNGNINKKNYDINLNSIVKKETIGNIKEIDNIHNNKLVTNMSFDKMMLTHFSNTLGRLHNQVNNSVLSLHNRSLENDPFFNP